MGYPESSSGPEVQHIHTKSDVLKKDSKRPEENCEESPMRYRALDAYRPRKQRTRSFHQPIRGPSRIR